MFLDDTKLETHTHTPGTTPVNEWAVRRRGSYLHKTQQTQDTNIHALTGIRTRDPSNETPSDPPLSSHGQGDREVFNCNYLTEENGGK